MSLVAIPPSSIPNWDPPIHSLGWDQLPSVPDYRLLKPIGRGGFGKVYLVETYIGRFEALKVIRRTDFEHESEFFREFYALRAFAPISNKHHGFLRILHVGAVQAETQYYYATELADDLNNCNPINPSSYAPKTLETLVKKHRKLSLAECLYLGLKLCSALRWLHGHGLVHRDAKPANILIVNGEPKLGDYSLVAEQGRRTLVGRGRRRYSRTKSARFTRCR